MKIRGLPVCVFAFFPGISLFGLWPVAAASAADAQVPRSEIVQLVGPAELAPGSTLEFRFANPMIAADALGPVAQGPFLFEPDMDGSFVWLSTRSGVFLPTGALSLGQKWKIFLRPELKDANGNPVETPEGRLVAQVETPPFQVTATQTGVWDPENVMSTVEPRIAFNAPVDLNSVRGNAFFRSADGQEIPAEVRYATERDYFSLSPEQDMWIPADGPAGNSEEPREFPNRLIFRSAEPLPPSPGWRFEIGAGVRSNTGLVAAQGLVTLDLGNVQPLELFDVDAQNLVLSGPMVLLSFNMPLAPDITTETAADFFQIEPSPENLRWTVDWNGVTARGSFPVGQPHTLRIGKDVLGMDGRPFAGARERSFTVGPVPSRLYLPAVTGQQLRFGRREFPVRWVNAMGLEFEALRVAPKDLPSAREAMKKYSKSEWDQNAPDEVYQPLEAGAIRGEKLKIPPLALPAAGPNRPAEMMLPWDQILGDNKPGAVFLTVKARPVEDIGGPSPGAQALIQLTDIGLLWKQDRKGLHAHVFSMQTGAAMPGVKLSLWDEELQIFSSGETGADGRAVLAMGNQPSWILAETGGDAEILPLGNEANVLPVWSFRTPVEYGPWQSGPDEVNEGWRGMLFTDRPLYQAGEAIKIRGFLRRIQGSSVALPGPTDLRLSLFSPNGEEVESKELAIGDAGDVVAEFVAPFSPRGEYRLAFQPGKDAFPWWQGTAETSFVVADYQPDAFEVHAEFHDRPTADGLPVAAVSANYFFGGSLGESTVRWTLQSSPAGFSPSGFSSFQFLAFPEEGAAVRTVTGEATLPGGRKNLDLELPAEGAVDVPREEVLTVEITDINQQTVATSASRRIESSDFYLGLAPVSPGLVRAGEDLPIRAVAVLPGGEPATEPVDYTATLIWRRPDVLRVQGAGQSVTFQTTITEVPVGEVRGKTLAPRREGDDWSVAEQPAVTLQIPRSGSYLLRIEARDAQGRRVVTEQFVYASGEDETVWDFRNPYEIDLVPERTTYAPGETARILVKNPLPGPAVIFVERGQNILRSWNVELEGNAPVIEVPLTEMDAPNVFVSVVALRGAESSARKFPMPEFRHGLCQLRVVNPDDELAVGISANAKTFQPGETIRTEVVVRSAEGSAVAGAGVTVWAVDDGILSLTGYEKPDPLGIFRAALPLGVRTGISLTHLLAENPEDLQFANKGYLIGGGGMDAAGLRFREIFPGTIAWFPDLKTGADGSVEVEFSAPDALTRYRILAVAHADATRFGSAETAVGIRKPLMLLSGMGSGAHAGDELVARAVLRNESGNDLNIRWQLQVEGANALGGTSGLVKIAAGESAVLETPVEFDRVGTARLEWVARADAESGTEEITDALAVELPVRSPMLTLHETYFPEINPGANDLTSGVNPQVLEGRGNVRVSVGNTRLVGLETSASYLLEYPYGCAEQTASALVPWLLPALQPVLPAVRERMADAPQVIREGFAKLLDFRTTGGGIGMWPGSGDASHFATAWTAIVWAQAAKSGISTPPFPDAILDWLAQSLRQEPRDSDPAAWTQRALTLFALSLHGKAQPAYAETMLQRAGLLPQDARSLLALALVAHKEEEGAAERGQAAAGLLRARSSVDAGFDPFADANRSQAIRLLALVSVIPDSAEIAPTVAELLAARRQGQWGNTQSNAWALMALNLYREVIEVGKGKTSPVADASGGAKGTLEGPGRNVAVQLPGAATAAVMVEAFEWPGPDDSRKLALQNPQNAKWFAEASFAITPPLGIQPPQNRGFGVTRTIRKIAPDGSLGAPENLRVGDRVLVTLELENSQPASFVALVDPLPAIFEALNPDFRPERAGVLPAGSEFANADFREILSGEVRFFIDRLAPGRHAFSYLARVRQAGTAIAPGTRVEEMYRPERFGLGAAETLEAGED